MRPYTMDNIEDWDFRSWRSPLLEGGSSYSDPATIFLEKHLFEVLAIDHVRLIVIKSILDHDLGHLAPEKSALLLTPEASASCITRRHGATYSRRMVGFIDVSSDP
jgi:hypothetical protein